MPPSTQPPSTQPPSTPTLRAAVRVVVATASGLLTAQAFPTHDVWWLAPVGVALLSAVTIGTRWRLALVLGLAHGLGFFLPTLSWSGVYVGNLPWVALSTLEALYIAVMCAVTTVVQRPLLASRLRPLAYAAVPLAWVLQEWARGTTPFGGFPWARLAFSQADSPLAPFARFAGAPGLTFAVASLGVLLHLAAGELTHRVGRPRRGLPAAHRPLGAALVLLGLAPLGLAVATTPPTAGRAVSVLFVQGNVPKPGLDFNAERRKVLDNHVQGTVDAVATGHPAPTLVVWPENSSDIDPLQNADAAADIDMALQAVKAPLLVGAVLNGPAPYISNASLFYRPGSAEPERYVKQHPVPFAEYIPYRSFFRNFSDKVDLVTRDFTRGHEPGGFEVPVAGEKPYWIIPTICFEVAYDGLMRDSTLQPGRGASILAVQTNNATFGYTAESEQQFAISRLRAIEHGRSVVHVSTVGVSGFINPDGTSVDKTSLFTAAARYGSPVVRTEVTPSDRLGPVPEYAAGLAFAGLLALGLWLRRRTARVVRADDGPSAPATERRDRVVV
ncbi:apolipoprotein N-acyltransferase [Pedococcus dokdonensis]|uniref:apolipoprotein N-acyltransferase n=1 Tax=Pedococcus dokdonensis TaxID=443156 RepID=UPI001E4657E0|nr:apolipoprotein N-acyltransferase [Pedococcus dokdonensis]